MYRIAVCEDDPRTAQQNRDAACRALAQKGRIQGRDYDIDVFHTAPPLMERLAEDQDAYQTNPAHLAVAETVRASTCGRACVDYEIA